MTGSEIKAERLALGLSQDVMAQRIGVTPNTYRAWEWGKRPIPQPVVNLLAAWYFSMLIPPEVSADPKLWYEARRELSQLMNSQIG